MFTEICTISKVFCKALKKEEIAECRGKRATQRKLQLEDGILNGGFGEKIASFYGTDSMKVKNYGLEKEFYDRYNANELLDKLGITPEKICEFVKENL